MDWRVENKLKQKAQEYYEKEFSYNQVYIQGYSDGYEKAIDEFAEKLCEKFTYKSINVLLNGYETDILTLDGTAEIIVDIAEQMKAGEIDG